MIKKAKSIPKNWRESRTYKEAVCPVCGTYFVSKYRGKNEGWTIYCEANCRNELKRKGEYRNCETCGKEFYIPRAHIKRSDDGYERGRFCSQECFRKWRSTLRGEETPNWQGGKFIGANGYVYVRHNGKYELEHRVVMEKYLGRKLREDEVVHHKNGVKTDNRLENLQLMTNSEHTKLHCKIRKEEQKLRKEA